MTKYIETTGKTEELAVAAALEQLVSLSPPPPLLRKRPRSRKSLPPQ